MISKCSYLAPGRCPSTPPSVRPSVRWLWRAQIFDGEEFSKMARLWTHGYDVYTPKRSYIVHDYSHPDDATVRPFL